MFDCCIRVPKDRPCTFAVPSRRKHNHDTPQADPGPSFLEVDAWSDSSSLLSTPALSFSELDACSELFSSQLDALTTENDLIQNFIPFAAQLGFFMSTDILHSTPSQSLLLSTALWGARLADSSATHTSDLLHRTLAAVSTEICMPTEPFATACGLHIIQAHLLLARYLLSATPRQRLAAKVQLSAAETVAVELGLDVAVDEDSVRAWWAILELQAMLNAPETVSPSSASSSINLGPSTEPFAAEHTFAGHHVPPIPSPDRLEFECLWDKPVLHETTQEPAISELDWEWAAKAFEGLDWSA
ncbi:Zn(2)-C6 fungal-type domain-containing protein [Mycena chlorophos]|uniref:Zn(2)-C6 fungal-type domain-containing protein n=1 Tax=Mycena chlorophos TaxID=658473 RepID=A0A8H6SBM4_MYCCL|nr:Zn(2)-C6 fungal-type domain-containing protein [Mycena chlorophos]